MPSAIETYQEGPSIKRQKITNGVQRSQPGQASRIFAPFRTIGLVSSTEVPFTTIPLGKTTFQVTTSVGSCLQTYDLKRGLNLVFLTRPQTPESITATLAWKDKVFAAWGGSGHVKQGLWIFKRGKKDGELALPLDMSQRILQILAFGSWIIACCSTRIEVFKSTTLEHWTTIHSTVSIAGDNEIITMCTLPTYLNKIFVGRKDGAIDIWNVGSGKLIYTILPPAAGCGAVTSMQATPALDLMAIAYSEGSLIIHNVRTDTTLMYLNTDSLVTTISFRTDGLGAGEDGQKDGLMATAGPMSGDVTFWDLNNGGRVKSVLRGAHNPPSETGFNVGGGINKIEFLVGQPVIITGGFDNSLKSWIFDETPISTVPRILHSRNGHAAPVTRLKFVPPNSDDAATDGKWLLSAGKDRSLWGWSLRRDGQSTELSQGNIRKKAKKLGILAMTPNANQPMTTLEDLKAPEITCIATSLNRDGGMGAIPGGAAIWQKGNQTHKMSKDATESGNTGWESVVTGHSGDKYARTWFWGRKRAGRWAFETGDGGFVSSVAISPCGTFAIVGSELGGIDMFNLQSGLHRRRFPPKLTPVQAKKLRIQRLQEEASGIESVGHKKFQAGLGKHTKAVTGIIVDSVNKHMISCSLDGKVKFWDFSTGNLVDEIDWAPMGKITSLTYHAANDLIAITCDDMAIRIVDIETKKMIRELWGSKGGINDLCFSNNGRWVIGASGDGIIRVWDLPTGHLIDAIRTATPCTALAFSGTGEFLATACEGDIGVNIWTNKTLFAHVPIRHLSEDEIGEVSAPTASGEGGQNVIEAAFEESEEDVGEGVPIETTDQLSEDMMTLSLVPKSRWQTLLHLDIIKQRNKPIEPPKAPEKAPFFLPSTSDSRPAIVAAPDVAESETGRSRILKMGRGDLEGEFSTALRAAAGSGDYAPFIAALTSLSPSAADLEIRSLSPTSGELTVFVEALTARLKEKRDYELVQAWMNVFLKMHSDVIIGGEDEGLRDALKKWRAEQDLRLNDLVGYCAGVVGFLRNPR